jgi:hypothetical protein
MDSILKSQFDADGTTLIGLPVDALLGVTTAAADVLRQALNIRTVFDLATNDVFAHAARIVDAAANGSSEWSRCGRVPSGVIDRQQPELPGGFASLVSADVQTLVGIGPVTAPAVKQALTVTTIRDLALWPPFLAARSAMRQYLGAGDELAANENQTPADLLPVNGRYPTERTQYNVLVLDRLMRSYPTQALEGGVQIDIMDVDHQTTTENNPAFGALLTYSQSWYTLGLTLGQLLHSVALAPGESTRIAVIDWARQLSSRVTQEARESEALVSDLARARSIKEVVSAVAAEMQRGESKAGSHSEGENFGFGFGYGTGTGTAGSGSYGGFNGVAAAGDSMGLGISYGQASGTGSGWAWSSSLGKREIAADTAQQITDRTHQASMATRNRWASVVREVSQSEHESLSTRAVTNFNHMHAMTIQYYEVVQLYRVVAELAKVQRCLFLPMAQLDFGNDAVVKRFRHALAAAARSPAVQMLALTDLGAVCISFPSGAVIPASDRPYFVDWGLRNGVTVNVRGRALFVNADGEAFDIGGFRLANPEGSKPEDFVFASMRIEFSDGRCFEQVLDSAEGSTIQHCSREHFYHATREFPLTDIRRILLRKNPRQLTFAGVSNNLDISLTGPSGQHTLLCGQRLQPSAGADTVVAWEVAPIDHGQWTRAKADLVANRLHYSQAAWRAMDPATLSQLLSSYSLGGHQLLDLIDIQPIGIAGSYLVFPLNLDDADWTRFVKERGVTLGTRRESIVSLPSGGVFAEAVLGRSNSAEKLDLTRFWNWADSPIPVLAPEIAPLASDSRSSEAAESDQPQGFGTPLLNIVNPPAAPDPAGLAAILTAIQNGNMFRDMSGLSSVIGMAQSSVASALQAAQAAAGTAADEAKAAMVQAGKNLEVAAKTLESMYGKGGGSGAGSSQPGAAANAPATVSNLGAKFNAADKLDREAASQSPAGKTTGTTQGTGAGATTGGVSGAASGATASGTPSATTGASRRDQILGTSGLEAAATGTATGQPAAAERFDHDVPGAVPTIAQPHENLCWAAAAAMMLGWRDQTSYTIEQVVTMAGPAYLAHFQKNEALPFAEKPELVARLGMQSEPFMNRPAAALAAVLQTVGPLWVSTDEDASPALSPHARILVGMHGDGSAAGTQMQWIDPDGGRAYGETFGQFVAKFEALVAGSGRGSLPLQIIHFPPGVAGEGAGAVANALGVQAVALVGELAKDILKSGPVVAKGFENLALVLKAYPDPADYYSTTDETTHFSLRFGMNLLADGLTCLRGSFQLEWMDNLQLKAARLGNGAQAKALRSIRFKKAIGLRVVGLTAGEKIEAATLSFQLRDCNFDYTLALPRAVVDLDIHIAVTPRGLGHPITGSVRVRDVLNPANPVLQTGGYVVMDNPGEGDRDFEPFVLLQ